MRILIVHLQRRIQTAGAVRVCARSQTVVSAHTPHRSTRAPESDSYSQPMPQAMKIPDAREAVNKKWKKLEMIPAWQLDKVKSKREVVLEAQRDKKKVHFASLVDICHFKIAEFEPKLQKYKGRVVLRGDSVIDDSGACAVLTEQGSSASQMTAAKVMDVIARLPDCDEQAADAVSAYTQVKIGGRSQIAQNSNVRLSRYMDTSSTTQMAEIMVKHRLVQWFLLNEICTDTNLLVSCGRDSSKKFHWNLDGRKCRIGNVFLFIENKDYSYRYMWMTSKWLERSKIWLSCGRNE